MVITPFRMRGKDAANKIITNSAGISEVASSGVNSDSPVVPWH